MNGLRGPDPEGPRMPVAPRGLGWAWAQAELTCGTSRPCNGCGSSGLHWCREQRACIPHRTRSDAGTTRYSSEPCTQKPRPGYGSATTVAATPRSAVEDHTITAIDATPMAGTAYGPATWKAAAAKTRWLGSGSSRSAGRCWCSSNTHQIQPAPTRRDPILSDRSVRADPQDSDETRDF